MRSLSVLMVVAAFGMSTYAQQPAKPAPTPVPPPSDVAKPPADATKTASGLSFKVLQAGKGTIKPDTDDFVTVHYTGWTTDGKSFDSTSWRNAPSSFPVNRVIKGWGEGVQLMVVGEKRRFWIPKELAYNGAAGRPEGMLVFDVEMMEIRSVAAARRGCPARRCAKAPLRHRLQSAAARHRHHPSHEGQHRDGALHGMDHRRKDV